MNRMTNIDSILESGRTDSSYKRLFNYDAFLSHRTNDDSLKLQKLLQKADVKVWVDHAGDLRDRKVISKVNSAVQNSRYVIAYVSQDFQNSLWCRAEYLVSLKAEADTQTVRVLVVKGLEGAVVPRELSHCPSFTLSPESIKELASLLKTGNSTNLNPSDIVGRVEILTPEQKRWLLYETERIWNQQSEPDQQANATKVLHENLAGAVQVFNDCGISNAEFNTILYNIRCYLLINGRWQERDTKIDLQTYSVETLNLIHKVASWAIESPNSDNVSNALQLLLWLVKLRFGDVESLVFDFLKRNRQTGHLETVLSIISNIQYKIDDDKLVALELATLREPRAWKNYLKALLFQRLSPTVRLYVTVKINASLDISLLTFDEQLSLVSERLNYVNNVPFHYMSTTPVDDLQAIYNIPDIEITIRELYDLLFDDFGKPRPPAFINGVFPSMQVINILARTVKQSLNNKGRPLVFLQKNEIQRLFHTMFIIINIQGDDHSEIKGRTFEVYGALCKVVKMYTDFSNEAPIYQHGLEQLQKGVEIMQVCSTVFESLEIYRFKANRSLLGKPSRNK
jgi:hypothetical protein